MNSYGLGSGTTQGNAPTEQTLKGYMLRRKKYFHWSEVKTNATIAN